MPIYTIVKLLISISLVFSSTDKSLDIQGHRGARGLMPENTIPGFLKALELGVTTLELDVVISKDQQVVISHEPYFSNVICLDSLGNVIPKNQAKTHNIYTLTYHQIQQYDCGSKVNPKYPQQQKMVIYKPLLGEMIRQVEEYILQKDLSPVNYNIEIKSTQEGDNIYHPEVDKFCELVYNEIKSQLPMERVNIQSFDFRALRYMHNHHPEVVLSVLIENVKSVDKNIEELGFQPQIYSCYYKLITPELLSRLHQYNMRVIPWTVNEVEDMERLINLGVDGLITDYPDRALQFLKSK